ncbi:MAG TPA: 50S ribosomal protein L32 [Anaerolineae bacterium]|nr:50S ribosomal protein L32 [Anaerolineae bacterium]
MGALPKRKISKARRDRRRTHDKAQTFHLVNCPNCGEKRRAHHMCPSCRTYKGIQVLPSFED